LNRRKTRAEYIISRNLANRQKQGKKSRPEEAFNKYQESRRLGLIWDKTFKMIDPKTGEVWDIQCDFLRPTPDGKFDIDFEIDGKKFHHKPSKDHWRDSLKINFGFNSIIHIPTEYVKRKWWAALDRLLPEAIASAESVVYIDEYA